MNCNPKGGAVYISAAMEPIEESGIFGGRRFGEKILLCGRLNLLEFGAVSTGKSDEYVLGGKLENRTPFPLWTFFETMILF